MKMKNEKVRRYYKESDFVIKKGSPPSSLAAYAKTKRKKSSLQEKLTNLAKDIVNHLHDYAVSYDPNAYGLPTDVGNLKVQSDIVVNLIRGSLTSSLIAKDDPAEKKKINPKKARTPVHYRSKQRSYPFARMEAGEFIRVSNVYSRYLMTKYSNAARNWALKRKDFNKKFTTRKVDGGINIYRIK